MKPIPSDTEWGGGGVAKSSVKMRITRMMANTNRIGMAILASSSIPLAIPRERMMTLSVMVIRKKI